MNFMNPFRKQCDTVVFVYPNEVFEVVQSLVLISSLVLYFTDTCFEWKFSISLDGCG